MVIKKLKTLHSLRNNSDNSCSSPEPKTGMGENCEVASNKRKACAFLESPSKKPRGDCKVTEVAAEAATAKGTKRKSSTQRESPKKRQRSERTDTSIGEATKVSVETKREKEASAEQPPAAQAMTRKESSCDPSLISSSPSTSAPNNRSTSDSVTNRDFEAKYVQLSKLGEGGCGSVYAGTRKTDNLPVAIKHIWKAVRRQPVVLNGNTHRVPTEVLLMQRAAGGPESVGKSAAVTLLDWYDLDQEVVLVMERPVPSVDLDTYLTSNNGPLEEDQAKNIIKQLLEAATEMHSEGVFHRDLKSDNVLIETNSDVPRVRVIDFGCGCFVEKTPYHNFAGTFAYAPPEFFIQGTYEAAPTTVWQLGALLYELLDGYDMFITSKYLRTIMKFNREIKELNVSQDCQDLLMMCLAVDPKERITLEQMQRHPWFTKSCKTQPPNTTN